MHDGFYVQWSFKAQNMGFRFVTFTVCASRRFRYFIKFDSRMSDSNVCFGSPGLYLLDGVLSKKVRRSAGRVGRFCLIADLATTACRSDLERAAPWGL